MPDICRSAVTTRRGFGPVRRGLRFLFQCVAGIYFRDVEIAGDVPRPDTGGRLFAANHVNALVDPILVLTQAPCPISPVAKSTLWKIPGLRWLLDAADAVPIVRRRDDPGKTAKDNDAIFERVGAHLAGHGNILIFPEGTSHNEPHVLSLRSGAGRMLARAREDGGSGLTFQAVALEFDAREVFRSRTLVLFGPVRSVDEVAAALGAGDLAQVITDVIGEDLAELLVEGSTWEERILLVRAAELLANAEAGRPSGASSLAQLNELGRRIEEARRLLQASAPGEVTAIETRVDAYFRALEDDGATDDLVVRFARTAHRLPRALDIARVRGHVGDPHVAVRRAAVARSLGSTRRPAAPPRAARGATSAPREPREGARRAPAGPRNREDPGVWCLTPARVHPRTAQARSGSVHRMRLVCSSVVALVSVLAIGCPRSTETSRPDGGAASGTPTGGDASADGAPPTTASGSGGGEDVEPVYPVEANAPPLPLAEKLCNALTTLPEKRRADCCKAKPSVVITVECTRQLSAALRHNAVAVDEKDVDACIAAFDKTLEGCDWVGPFPPGPPAACQGIFKGKLAAGTRCRSSLECAADLRCKDLGPTAPGKCGPAGTSEATSCGGTVDSLATYTRQNDVDKRHPECTDRCIKHKCQKPVDDGGSCLISSDCLEGMQCLPAAGPLQKNGQAPRKCVAGKAPSKEGEACPGDICEGALQCIRGKCTNKKAGGEACTDDFECRGGCLRAGGSAKGTCGPRCDIR